MTVKPTYNERPLALLITPPIYDFALYDLFLKPYGLLKIGSRLKNGGWRVHYINTLSIDDPESRERMGNPRRKKNGTGKFFRMPLPLPSTLEGAGIKRPYARYGILRESFAEKIFRVVKYKGSPDVVFISSGMTYWYPGVKEAVEIIRAVSPKSFVIVGGIYASLMPEHCQKVTSPDKVIVGGASPEIDIILEKRRLPLLGEDDGHPLYIGEGWQDAGILRLNTGCPHRCAYCASAILHPKFECGSPKKVIKSIQRFHQSLGITQFAFYDDALLANREVFIELLERIIALPYNYEFYLPNALHHRLLTTKILDLMKKAGFREIRLGVESDAPEFHQRYDAKGGRKEIDDVVSKIRSSTFPLECVSGYVLAGLPEQKPCEVERSLRFLSSTGIRGQLALYSPTPASSLWNESLHLSSFPLQSEPLWTNNTLQPMRWEKFTTQDMENLKVMARSL